MKTLKKYISVIAVSTAGFTVDTLKKYVGVIAVISACLAWVYMIALPHRLPIGCSECSRAGLKTMLAVYGIIAVFSGTYAIARGKTELTRFGGYLTIFLMFTILCVLSWLTFKAFVK